MEANSFTDLPGELVSGDPGAQTVQYHLSPRVWEAAKQVVLPQPKASVAFSSWSLGWESVCLEAWKQSAAGMVSAEQSKDEHPP